MAVLPVKIFSYAQPYIRRVSAANTDMLNPNMKRISPAAGGCISNCVNGNNLQYKEKGDNKS